jgi:GTP cyclohydrolase I
MSAAGMESTVKRTMVREMLLAIGENPDREGLLETPDRVVRAWGEWFAGYKVDPLEFLRKDFEDGAEKADEMVLLTNIPVQSHCEHHITPIIGVAHVAYIPKGRVVGISKLARVVDAYSRRLQIQERLTNQIADAIEEVLQPQAVGVIITAQHFCMTTRGCKTPGVDTTTSALRGAFKHEPEARAEFISLVQMASTRQR